jgi:hypothetical protein
MAGTKKVRPDLALIPMLELPLNSWSRETFEVYYFRERVSKHEESAKDLYR